MEKFSNWRDKGSGISPFMPIKPPYESESVFYRVLRVVAVVLRTPFFMLAFLLYSILPLNGLCNFILTILFGLHNLHISVDGVKRTSTLGIQMNLPHGNEIIVTNYLTPLDGYIYKMISKASIVILVPDEQGNLYSYTPWSLFFHTFTLSKPTGTPCKDLTKFKNKAVFLLLEGTPSNNKALLPFVDLKKYDFTGFKWKSMVVKINPEYYTLPVPNISFWKYLFNCMCHFGVQRNFVKIKFYPLKEFNTKEIRNTFEMNQIVPIGNDLNINEKRKFFAYFQDFKVKDD